MASALEKLDTIQKNLEELAEYGVEPNTSFGPLAHTVALVQEVRDDLVALTKKGEQ